MILRETDSFKLVKDGDTYRVEAKPSNVTPRKLRIRKDTANELLRYSDETFDMSCVWDLGVGVFERD
jgi:hypothetical protein